MPETSTRQYATHPAELPEGTLVELYYGTIDRFNEDDALRAKGPDGKWHSMSHAALHADVERLGVALQRLGLARGDRVAILSENRIEWQVADFACLCAGIVDVPVYATLPASQIQHILSDSGARAVFVSDDSQLAKVREIRASLPRLEYVIVFDGADRGDALGYRALIDAVAAVPASFRQDALAARPHDVATILYTSGTTGLPKGVMLTHNNLFSNTAATAEVLPTTSADVAMSFLPLSHIFERMVDYRLFSTGCTLAYVSSFDLVAQSLKEVRPTIVASTPRMYEKFYARVLSVTGPRRRLVFWARAVAREWADAKLSGHAPGALLRLRHRIADRLVFSKLRENLGGRLRFFVSGGAPLSPEIARFFYGAGVTILEGYGLTETSPVTNVNTPVDFRIGTVGKPIAGTEIAIADDGEVLVRGPQVMKGYYNNPEATRAAIDADGWFHTGDIGVIDADGFLRITDRKKDLIVTAGGKNIAPQPIENEAKLSRYVSEAVMLGDRRPYPVMLIVPNFDNVESWAAENGIRGTREALAADPRVLARVEEDVLRKLQHLARFEMPKKFALLPEEFTIDRGELTPSGKVRRRIVQERYAPVIESLYGHEAAEVA